MLIFKLAWRNLWRQTRRTLITAGAMSAGIALCLASLAWMDGFFDRFFEGLVERNYAHVQVHNPEFPKQRSLFATIEGADDLMRDLRKQEMVTAVSARVYGYALVAASDEAAGARLTGIVPADEDALVALRSNVVDGEYLSSEPDNGCLVGHMLAEDLKVKVGDELVAVTQAADGSMGNER